MLVAMVKPDLPTGANLYVLPADSNAAARTTFMEKVGLFLQENVENMRQT